MKLVGPKIEKPRNINLAGIRTPAENDISCLVVKTKGTPKSNKNKTKQKGELNLGKINGSTIAFAHMWIM